MSFFRLSSCVRQNNIATRKYLVSGKFSLSLFKLFVGREQKYDESRYKSLHSARFSNIVFVGIVEAKLTLYTNKCLSSSLSKDAIIYVCGWGYE